MSSYRVRPEGTGFLAHKSDFVVGYRWCTGVYPKVPGLSR